MLALHLHEHEICDDLQPLSLFALDQLLGVSLKLPQPICDCDKLKFACSVNIYGGGE